MGFSKEVPFRGDFQEESEENEMEMGMRPMQDGRLNISHDKTEENSIGEGVFILIHHTEEAENEDNDEVEMGM